MTVTPSRRPALPLDQDPFGVIDGGLVLGSARMSIMEQTLHRRIDAMAAAICGRFFQNVRQQRRRLTRTVKLPGVRAPNIVVTITGLWRLSRDFQNQTSILSGPRQRMSGIRALRENLDITKPGVRTIFHVFAAFSEFIREMDRSGHPHSPRCGRAAPDVPPHRPRR